VVAVGLVMSCVFVVAVVVVLACMVVVVVVVVGPVVAMAELGGLWGSCGFAVVAGPGWGGGVMRAAALFVTWFIGEAGGPVHLDRMVWSWFEN